MEDTNDYINRLKLMIMESREDKARAQARIDALQEALNYYEIFSQNEE